MATRAQVSALLDRGHSYETAGRMLTIPASMIATGIAADGGDAPTPQTPQELARGSALPGSLQQLVNPAVFNPQRPQRLFEWVAGVPRAS